MLIEIYTSNLIKNRKKKTTVFCYKIFIHYLKHAPKNKRRKKKIERDTNNNNKIDIKKKKNRPKADRR